MKKLIFIVLIAFASCSKQVDATQQQQQLQQVAEPTAEIISTVKTYSGSNPSLRITYTLKSISSVKAIRLNNTLPIVVKEGGGIIQDPAAGFTNNYFYYWVFDMQDGTQKITNPQQYFF